MADIINFNPAGAGTGSIVKLVWSASQGLLEAARAGQRETAARLGIWLANTASDPRCTPRLAHFIDSRLATARQRLGGAGTTFEPIQPDDGEAA